MTRKKKLLIVFSLIIYLGVVIPLTFYSQNRIYENDTKTSKFAYYEGTYNFSQEEYSDFKDKLASPYYSLSESRQILPSDETFLYFKVKVHESTIFDWGERKDNNDPNYAWSWGLAIFVGTMTPIAISGLFVGFLLACFGSSI